VVCSKAHGGNRQHFVSDDVIVQTITRLIETGKADYKLQLGGDGDAFLHPKFLDYVQAMRFSLPEAWRCLYSSGFSLTKERADRIQGGGLLNELQVRIDSLDPQTYYESTGMFLDVVLENLRYFASINTHARFCIIYLPLHRYRQFCETILGKPPTYFGRIDESRLRDEWADVQEYFGSMKGPRDVETRVTGLSLWAERTDCEFSDYPCPRLPENVPGDMARQLYVYPNGDYGLCGYDDGQDTFILGNVFEHSINEVWNGPTMQGYMNRVRSRTAQFHPGCCINSKACVMWEEIPLP
jgi:MoaA/NifB/PqqE/SkfB family radical SAM enzyme